MNVLHPAPRLLVAFVAGGLLPALLAGAPVDVTSGRFQPTGTGANLAETVLNTSNVNASGFGKLFSYEVDGFVYAQPLIVSDLTIRGRARNVLYVATMSNVLYALDADDPSVNGGLLWSVRFSDGGAFPVPASIDPWGPLDPAKPPYGHQTVQGNYGILSTPVIDRSRNAIYVLVRTLESSGYIQRLHSIDLVSGRERPGSPVEISASVQVGGHTIRFDPKFMSNRSGLALSKSTVVLAWATSNKAEEANYRGWVMTYDADRLVQTGVLCTTAGSGWVGGGIWQAGRPPAVDAAGDVYYYAGNGWTSGTDDTGVPCKDPHKPAGYLGESLLRLQVGSGLHLVGSWTPADWCDLDNTDTDLGGSGPALINVTIGGSVRTLAVGGGKGGALYAIDTGLISAPDIVAGRSGKDGAIPGTPYRQSFCIVAGCPEGHHIMGGPAIWQRADRSGGSLVYVSVENDAIRAFHIASSVSEGAPVLSTTPVSKTHSAIQGHPGAILSLSANGDSSGTGILWATFASDNTGDFVTDASFSTKRGQLVALDAENIGRTLWTSETAPDRDSLGHFAKFNPPTIANGKVYVAAFPTPEPYIHAIDCDRYNADKTCAQLVNQTYSSPNSMGQVVVYGLNPPAQPFVRSFVSDVLPALLNAALR